MAVAIEGESAAVPDSQHLMKNLEDQEHVERGVLMLLAVWPTP